MLRRILDAHGGALPENVHVLFANTGKERTETLDFVHECGVRWGVPIHWIEYNGRDVAMPVARAVIDGVVRLPHMEVTYDTASRNGEPFARLISERQYTPNVVTRFCTEILKIRAMKRWLMARGYEEWSTTVGLRADEMRRVTRITSPEAERERERRFSFLSPAQASPFSTSWTSGRRSAMALRLIDGFLYLLTTGPVGISRFVRMRGTVICVSSRAGRSERGSCANTPNSCRGGRIKRCA
jgi:3'-phosphoadenosine 5'-phosphosulfate sulfotransferase (PAPS reductase)/FAD synthetase